jgi:hypothetical protein
MTLTPDSEPDELFQVLDAYFTGKFDATTSNHIWAAFRLGVEAAEAAKPQLDAEEWDDVAEIVADFSRRFYTTDEGLQFVEKLRNIAKEAKEREDA